MLFTQLGLALEQGLSTPAPDKAAIDQLLRFPMLRSWPTGLRHVTEILAGESHILERPEARTQQWTPWDYVDSQAGMSPQILREVILTTVHAWSERFPRLQLELSGGFDSSVLAFCLKDRTRPWRSVNLATKDPEGDERVYARAVAYAAGSPLEELGIGPEGADPLIPLGRLRVRPGGVGLLAECDRLLGQSADQFGADAILSGTGGDNVFCFLTTAAPVVDALKDKGLMKAFEAAADLARLARTNIWSAWWHSVKRMQTARPIWKADHRFLTSFAGRSGPMHPWFEEPARLADGRRAHGHLLLKIMPFLDGYDRALQRPFVAPLLSQPIVEACLSIPSWEWIADGRDRAMARQAFSEMLPPNILRRRSKGGLESLINPVFAANRSAILRFIEQGWLASHGIVDCNSVRHWFQREPDRLDSGYLRILDIVDTERWVRSILALGATR